MRLVERDAAEKLAALHAVTAPRFGLERDTLIGPLPQPNPPTDDWVDFFRDQRLLYMADLAHEAGRLPAPVRAGSTRWRRGWRAAAAPADPVADPRRRVDRQRAARATAAGRLIDPAIYFADAEIELAFTTLFGTFGDSFFERYAEIRPIDDLREERICLLAFTR